MGACCCKEEEIDFDAEVELSHFHLLRSVGKGAFGKVRVVQHKQSKDLYALKYINKAKCIKMRAVENIIQERRLLEEIDYPLVCNLRYAFQDDENLFMVLDLMLGGDLRFHLERQGQMSENVVRFYVAEVSLALAYLHSKRIVHRDLKPDNVLLDDKGHAHLTDFNIAVHCSEKKPLMSVAGSMAYMAPEVLTKKGYYETVDWWSLGVVMYELLFSKRPFRGKTNSALTQAILHDPLVFPDNVHDTVSEECMDVIKRFCERDVSKRLGCGARGIEEIKRHPWFRDVEWDNLDTKEARAPFVPDSKRANFDATHELEELLLEDNPLKAKKRANPNQDLSELSKEMRMMEEKFLIYDSTKMRRRSYFTNNMNVEMASNQRRGSRNPRPQLSPLPLPETETTDPATAGIEEIRDDVEAKLNGEWLNERPVSPANREQRRRSAFLGSFGGSGRASPVVPAPHDSDNISAKPQSHSSPRTSSPSIISPQEQIRPPSSMSILTQATMTSLTPPPRVQSPTPKVQPISPSSRPTSPHHSAPSTPPLQSPSQSPPHHASPHTHLANRSNNSLRRLSAITSPVPPNSAPLLPPQGPPPNAPLPPPPATLMTTVEPMTETRTTMTMTLPVSSASASATAMPNGSPGRSKMLTVSTKRPSLLYDDPLSIPGADFADQPPTTNTFFAASTGTALTLHSGASDGSLSTSSNELHQTFAYVGDVSSAVTSALARVPSNDSQSHRRLSRSSLTSNGHYRSPSEVSSVEHGALSAVGVPAGV